MTDNHESLRSQAASLASLGAVARQKGEEVAAEAYYHDALGLARDAANRPSEGGSHPARLDALREAARFALDCGEVMEARRLMEEALSAEASTKFADEWAPLRDVTSWPDTWLIAAVRCDPPDVQALDALAERYWKPLFGRCQLLTLNHQKASDLAQEAWCRVLRTRHGLKPGGNFPAYLTTIATNLWRDCYRSERRAGPMADDRLEWLDAAYPNDEGESVALVDRIPDLKALSPEEQALLAARLLALARPWWETWPEQFRSVVERLGRIEIAYGHAMAEPRPTRGSHPVPALIVRTSEELETSVRVLYLNVRDGRVRLRFQVDAALGQEQKSLDVTFVCNTSQCPVVSANASLSVDNEYRLDAELPEKVAVEWEQLKVTDRMPFRLILRSDRSG